MRKSATTRARGGVLDRDFLSRAATEVAPALLGAQLRVGHVTVRITEVEAYQGQADPGSHAFRGRTKRTDVMFGEPGHLYTYFSYGMHVCANIVCSPEGTSSAVLLRAGEVIDGVEEARGRRTTSRSDVDLARGPARLCVALGITLADGGADLFGGRFQLDGPVSPVTIAVQSGPRTGVSGEGGSHIYPWRFWLPGEPSVSPYRLATSRKKSATPPGGARSGA